MWICLRTLFLLTLYSLSSPCLVWFIADEQRYLLTLPAFSKQLCAFILTSSLHSRQAERLVWWEAAARLGPQMFISNEVPVSQELKYVEPKLPGLKFPVCFSCPSWTLVHSLNSWVCGRHKNVWHSYPLYQVTLEGLGTFEDLCCLLAQKKASWWVQFTVCATFALFLHAIFCSLCLTITHSVLHFQLLHVYSVTLEVS